MRKYAILLTTLFALTLNAGPGTVDPEPVVDVVMKKLDAETLEVKTTRTTVQTIEHNRAEMETELFHIQKQIDVLNERAAELRGMLEILK